MLDLDRKDMMELRQHQQKGNSRRGHNTGSQEAAPLFLRVCLIRNNIHTIFTKVEVQRAHPCACYETHREEWTEPRHLYLRHLYLRHGPASGLPLLAVLSLSLILIGQSLFAALSLSLFLIDQYFMDLLH